MYKLVRSNDEVDEVDEVLNKAADGVDKGSRWPGMSFEQGVEAALLWAIDPSTDNPMEG